MALEDFTQFLAGLSRPQALPPWLQRPMGPAGTAAAGTVAAPAAPKTFQDRQQEALTKYMENMAANPNAAGGGTEVAQMFKAMRRDPLGETARANARLPGFTPQAAWDAWGPSARKKAPESDARAGIRMAGGEDPRIAAAQAPNPKYWGPGPATPAPGGVAPRPGAPAGGVPTAPVGPMQGPPLPEAAPGVGPSNAPFPEFQVPPSPPAGPDFRSTAPNLRLPEPMSWLDEVAQREGATMEGGTYYGKPEDIVPPTTLEGRSPHVVPPGRSVPYPEGNFGAQIATMGGAEYTPEGGWQTAPLPENIYAPPGAPTEGTTQIMGPNAQPITGMDWLSQVAQTAGAEGGPGGYSLPGEGPIGPPNPFDFFNLRGARPAAPPAPAPQFRAPAPTLAPPPTPPPNTTGLPAGPFGQGSWLDFFRTPRAFGA